MGFIYISLVVLAITTVAYLAKLSAKRNVSSFDFTFIMFAVATVLGYFFAAINHARIVDYNVELSCISIFAGIGGAMAVFIFNHAVRIGHFGYSNAIYRSSFLIPVIFSVIAFRTILNITTVSGILSILTSIFLVSLSNDTFAKVKDRSNILWFFIILGAFALSGLPRIGQLLISHYRYNSFVYLFLSYAAGFILFLIFFMLRQKRLNKLSLFYGSLAAFASFVGVYCTIESLKILPSATVFPITLSVPIILGMFVSLLHRERIKFIGWIGILLGICGIVMLSLQTYMK